MRNDGEIWEEIKEKVSLVDEMEKRGISFKTSGSNLKCVCPFHPDTDPSLYVYLHNEDGYESFNCFGCDEGGSVIDYIMAAEEISIAEALKYFSENYSLKTLKKGSVNLKNLSERTYSVKYHRINLKNRFSNTSWNIFYFLKNSDDYMKDLLAIKMFLRDLDEAASCNDEIRFKNADRVLTGVMLEIIKKREKKLPEGAKKPEK